MESSHKYTIAVIGDSNNDKSTICDMAPTNNISLIAINYFNINIMK